MTGRDRIILQKTINYARDAVEYISGMDFEQFMDDRKTISACAFCIGQIGELVKEVDPLTREANPQIPWRRNYRTSNLLLKNSGMTSGLGEIATNSTFRDYEELSKVNIIS